MNWPLLASTFVLIFVAELPDKTALAVLLMSTRKHPVVLFCGVALAFLVQTMVALVFGRVIGLLPQFAVHLGCGALFLASALYTFWSSRDDEAEAVSAEAKFSGSAFFHAFMVIFVAEWGDLTQLATASLVAQHPDDRMAVFFGALLGLWSVTAAVIFVGQALKSRVRQATMQKLSVLVFAGLGLYFVISAF